MVHSSTTESDKPDAADDGQQMKTAIANDHNLRVASTTPRSICGSTSSGEITDDSDDSCGNTTEYVPFDVGVEQTEHFDNDIKRGTRQEAGRDVVRHFDPKLDYRRPYLAPEQICSRVRKIPSPEVLSELNDHGLRCLIADIHELDREQNRLANNRSRLLEQMRAMHESEFKSLRETMESVKKLMSERGLNLLSTQLGRDVVEFIFERNAQRPMEKSMPAVESGTSNYNNLFPSAQSLSQCHPNSYNFGTQPHPFEPIPIKPESAIRQTIMPTIHSNFTLPPPTFSRPPPPLPLLNQRGVNGLLPVNSIATTEIKVAITESDNSNVPSVSGSGGATSVSASAVSIQKPLMSLAASEPSSLTDNSLRVSNSQNFRSTFDMNTNSPEPVTRRANDFERSNANRLPLKFLPLARSFFRPDTFFDDMRPLYRDDRRMRFCDDRIFPLYSEERNFRPFHASRMGFDEYEYMMCEDEMRFRNAWSSRQSMPYKPIRRYPSRENGMYMRRNFNERVPPPVSPVIRDRSPLSRPNDAPVINGGTEDVVEQTSTAPLLLNAAAPTPKETLVIVDENNKPVNNKE